MCLRSVVPCLMRPLKLPYSIYKLPPSVHPKCPIINNKPFITLPLATYKTKTTVNREVFDASKAKLVLKLNFVSPEDALPFYKLSVRTLVHIYKVTINDVNSGFCKNRLYYIASHLKCPPPKVSELVAKRTFIYSLSFEWLASSLKVLIDMKVPSERILRDLWVLKYHHNTIESRLQRVKQTGCDKLYPWMVRCSEEILTRYIDISQETKNILGDNQSTHKYIANRLNTSVDVIEDMCLKMPALKTIRVTKVKHFLDYLISEGYKEEEILTKPRVLSTSQKTVKERLETLGKLGLTNVNLNILCKSRKSFKKFCDTYESATKDAGSTQSIQDL